MIDVVTFQSFDSHLAQRLGCTTFSFALKLGVYLDSGVEDRPIRRGKQGRLLPYEYECPFRARLDKRTPVDGSARAGIFYVDASGSTMAACIQESRTLLQEAAPLWFSLFDDISRAIHYLENVDVDSLLPDCVRVGPGSGGLLETLATLKFLRYHANPTAENRQAVRDESEKLFGAYLNFPPAIDSGVMVQRQVIRIGRLVGEDQPIVRSSRFVAEGDRKIAVKRQVWPFLKQHGFSKFTTRVAYRTVGEVIEVSPSDWADRKLRQHRLEPSKCNWVCSGLCCPSSERTKKAGHSQCLIAKSSPGF